jgi:hypothetical protein
MQFVKRTPHFPAHDNIVQRSVESVARGFQALDKAVDDRRDLMGILQNQFTIYIHDIVTSLQPDLDLQVLPILLIPHKFSWLIMDFSHETEIVA